ncbi:MAG: Acetyltransferase (GNAT) family protein [Methanocella sp. PtaU1.Bin125]|nr:MAG: Acetyltransferase (GNAT) family protein [Methanocella sp. PtaU1.Bin125]
MFSIATGPATIRLARLDDAAAISRIHQSHVPRWYRKTGGEHCEVGYEALTLDERYGFGGQWMSTETCAIHLNNLLLSHHMPYVAETDGKPVAEMELFVSREGPPYGRACHIGLLYVDKAFTGHGIGAMMVEKALQYARENRCDSLTVSATRATEEFYRRCGFAFRDALVEIEALPGDFIVDVAPLPPPLSLQSFTWGMNMHIGRLQSSAYHVFEAASEYALASCMNVQRHIQYLTVNGHPSVFVCQCPVPGNAVVRGWSAGADAGDLVFAALGKAAAMGVRTTNMLLCRKDYEHVEGLIESRLIGTRRTLMIKL